MGRGAFVLLLCVSRTIHVVAAASTRPPTKTAAPEFFRPACRLVGSTQATVTVKSFAAKMREAENTVAVRVPTLVAVCVMAGVALGGLVTTFAPTKKIEETTPLVAAKA